MNTSHRPAEHYDRVTAAWTLLFGDELHCGIFRTRSETLAEAAAEMTRLMIEAARIEPGNHVLDVGCGTGGPACHLARTTGARVTGISTSAVGIEAAQARSNSQGLGGAVAFEVRDGMDNRFPDRSFDRVWALESAHLMLDKRRLTRESARVLKPGGRLAMCDLVTRRQMSFGDLVRLQDRLWLLREVFGESQMATAAEYRRMLEGSGLVVEQELDLSDETRETFSHWRESTIQNRDKVLGLLEPAEWQRLVDACQVLEDFWDDGTLGYALIAASKPSG